MNKKGFPLEKEIKIKSSYALEKDYYRKLKDFSEAINKSVLRWSLARYNRESDKNITKQLTFEFNELLKEWNKKAEVFAKDTARKLTKSAEKYTNAKFINVDNALNVKAKTKSVRNQLGAIYERNLSLIKTIPMDIIERYRNAFLNSIGSFDREALIKQAKEFKNISNRRAKTIARDQIQKAISGYTQARAQQLGFQFYKWETAQDERVSTGKGGHRVLHGRIYRYDTPTAIIDSYGNKGHCSERVNCRCVAVSIIAQPGEVFKLVKDSVAGDYYILQKGE